MKSISDHIISKQIITIIVLVFLFLIDIPTNSFGQSDKKAERWFNDAKDYYSKKEISRSIVLCEKILAVNPDHLNASLMLADIYNDLDSVNLEIEYLEKALKITENKIALLRLGEANYSLGKYDMALKYYKRYLESGSTSANREKDVRHKINNCRFAIEAIENPIEFNPERLSDSINSKNDEYWPSLSLDGNQLVFTRLMDSGRRLPQEDFFIARFDSSGWGTAQPIVEINTSDNEGAQSLSANGKLLFFTACNRKYGIGSCDIYYSKFEKGLWSVPQNLGDNVNSKNWDAKPSFSSDNKYLYFSSDRPGGKGNKDLWRSRFNGFNDLGEPVFEKPENLGNMVNTEGNEISPFIHPNNRTLYFGSDGHPGMGGIDLFYSELEFDNTFSSPVNLGYPINTLKNEQGLHISANGKTGYFASARDNEYGHDIYTFQISEELRPDPVSHVRARVMDSESQKPVLADVELIDLSAIVENRRIETTDEKGEVLIALPLGADYAFNVSKKGYLFYSQAFLLKDEKTISDPFLVEIGLVPIKKDAEMNLYNIYFETDSFTILPNSEPELLKLTAFLENNPDLKVEIQGHTDNTGNPESNKELSKKRAGSVMKYLIEKDIQSNRLNAVGYGEEKPVSTNETYEGRQLNRRTTIKILGE